MISDHCEHLPRSARVADAGGWILVTAIVSAPWAFGSRPYWATVGLAMLLFCAAGVWLVGCLREKRLPRTPLVCGCAVVFLSLAAGISLLNPQSAFESAHASFLPEPSYRPFLPTTVDVRNGAIFTVETLAVLFTVAMAADLSVHPRWRERFLRAAAFMGVSVSLAGLLLKAGFLPQVSRDLAGRPWALGQIFGPFDYHGNAGAFLNLTLPAVVLMAAAAVGPTRRLCWWAGVALCYAALFVNASRAAWGIGLLMSPVLLWTVRSREGSLVPAAPKVSRSGKWWLGILAAALAITAILLTDHYARPEHRVRVLLREMKHPDYSRYLQSRAAWEMARERPWFGAGVGSYKLLVQGSSIRDTPWAPSFRPGDPFTVLGYTHEDYLETLAEWGGVGFAAWVVLVAGAFAGLWKLLRRTHFRSRTAVALGAALSAVYIHALGDCPLQIPALQLYAAIYLGLAWGAPRWSGPVENLQPGRADA